MTRKAQQRTSRTARRDGAIGARSDGRPVARRRGGLVLVGILAALALAAGALSLAPAQLPAGETLVRASSGTYTDVTPDRLAQMLARKDFTLVNVRTPYIGEIAGTDLYIPYNEINARASELPADLRASVVVYCNTGVQSALAAELLLDLGYTNVLNLKGGMTAWTSSGRTLVDLHRQ